MGTRKTLIPSEQQVDSILSLFEIDPAQHAEANENLGLTGWAIFEGGETPQINVPGTRDFYVSGYDPVKVIPHGNSGLTIKAHLIEVSNLVINRPKKLELELYPLSDFEAIVRETAEKIVSYKIEDVIRVMKSSFAAQEILEMFKSSFENSDLSAVFKADRSAAIMQDSIEQAPEKPVKAFFTRGR